MTDLPQDETEERNRVISKDLVCSAFLRVALCEGDGEGRLTNVVGMVIIMTVRGGHVEVMVR